MRLCAFAINDKTIENSHGHPDNSSNLRALGKSTHVKKNLAVVISTLIACVVISALAIGQSSPRRRTPALTNDDLGSGSREVVTAPAGIDPPTSGPLRTSEARGGGIAWHRDLRSALQVARAEGKVIVADVYTDWCGWCKRMDKTVYADQSVVAFSREQVFVKLNAEDRGEGQSFAREMGVSGYPTTIVLDAQGKVLNVAEGYIASADAFIEMVERARATRMR